MIVVMNLYFDDCSPEAKPVLEDGLSEIASSLLAAYDSGELKSALKEGHTGWQTWVKSFGKSLKRKVCLFLNRDYNAYFSYPVNHFTRTDFQSRGNHSSCPSEFC